MPFQGVVLVSSLVCSGYLEEKFFKTLHLSIRRLQSIFSISQGKTLYDNRYFYNDTKISFKFFM